MKQNDAFFKRGPKGNWQYQNKSIGGIRIDKGKGRPICRRLDRKS